MIILHEFKKNTKQNILNVNDTFKRKIYILFLFLS